MGLCLQLGHAPRPFKPRGFHSTGSTAPQLHLAGTDPQHPATRCLTRASSAPRLVPESKPPGPACSTAYTKALRGPTGPKATTATFAGPAPDTVSSPKPAAEPPSPSPSFWSAVSQNSLCRTNRGEERVAAELCCPQTRCFFFASCLYLKKP